MMMNTSLMYALRVSGRTFAEDAKEAGTVTLLGMVAIFAVLALLWFLIELLHRSLTKSESSDQPKAQDILPEKTVAMPVAETASEASSDDGALVAAITAAISAAMAEDGYTGGFRVVSFKRSSVRKNGRG